jgi:hypothetical protein
MATRTRGAKEYRLLKESSKMKMASFTTSRKCGVRVTQPGYQGIFFFTGGFIGNR